MTQRSTIESEDDLANGPTNEDKTTPSGHEKRPDENVGRDVDRDVDVVGNPGRLRLLLEAVGMSLLTCVLAYRAVPAFRDRAQTFYEDVMVNAMGPDRHGFADWIRDGVFPAWLRTNYGGEPYMANTQHGVAYPGNLPFWLMDTANAVEVVIVLHMVLAAIGMWAYCRIGLRTSMWAGWLAGVCFALGGSTLSHVTLGGQIQVICLMPLVLFTGHMALERRKLRWSVACAVTIGMAFLAGHVEEWIYVMSTLALYGAAWIVFKERGGQLKRLGQAVLTLGGSVVLFVLLFSWQLLPSLLLQKQGYRNSPTFSQQYPLPQDGGINALLPDFGRVLRGENISFVGFAALCLVGLAVVARRNDWTWVRVWVVVSAALGFILALGNTNPIYSFLYDNVSLIHQFRVPSRWLLMTTIAFCVGAAIGLDELLTRYVGRWKARFTQGALALLALGLGFAGSLLFADLANDGNISWKRWGLAGVIGGVAWLLATVRQVPRAVPALILIVLTGIELVYARPGAEYRQVAPNALYDMYGGTLDTLGAERGRYVTTAAPPAAGTNQREEIPIPDEVRAEGGAAVQYFLAGYYSKIMARPGNNYGTQSETLLGRDGGFLPTSWYYEFYYQGLKAGGNVSNAIVSTPPSKWNWDALDLMALEWWVTGDNLPESERSALRSHGFEIHSKYGYGLLWHREGTSLARVVHQVDVVPDSDERVKRLQAGYPMLERAMVEQPVELDAVPAGATVGSQADQVSVAVRQSTVRVKVTTSAKSLLVLGDPWYPQWTVTVDGKKADLLRVDHALRGVVVPAGTHEVRFAYVDRRFQLGVGLMVITLLGLAATPLVVGVLRRRRRDDEVEGGPDGEPEREESAVPAAVGAGTAAGAGQEEAGTPAEPPRRTEPSTPEDKAEMDTDPKIAEEPAEPDPKDPPTPDGTSEEQDPPKETKPDPTTP